MPSQRAEVLACIINMIPCLLNKCTFKLLLHGRHRSPKNITLLIKKKKKGMMLSCGGRMSDQQGCRLVAHLWKRDKEDCLLNGLRSSWHLENVLKCSGRRNCMQMPQLTGVVAPFPSAARCQQLALSDSSLQNWYSPETVWDLHDVFSL